MRTIAIINQKGGCGKTTTAINLAAVFAKRGFRTLLVDLDPQSHCAAGLGVPERQIERDVADAMLASQSGPLERAKYLWSITRGLDLLPSRTRLAGLEASAGGLADAEKKERRLSQALERLSLDESVAETDAVGAGPGCAYDVCLIDCPPSIGLLTYNALVAARELLIPVETSYFSLQGAEKQLKTMRSIARRLGVRHRARLVATIHDASVPIARDLLGELRSRYPSELIPVIVRSDPKVREAASLGRPVIDYAPDSSGAEDFTSLCEWLVEHAKIERSDLDFEDDASEGADGPAPGVNVVANAGDGLLSPAKRAPATAVGGPVSSRLAEVADRVRRMSAATDVAPAPQAAARTALRLVESEAAPPATMDAGVRSLLGAIATSTGVLFVQPLALGERICIAGSFNGWSSSGLEMRRNPQRGVFEAHVALPPGDHQYRLVVDGRWIPDPYATRSIVNSFGEPNSVVRVPAGAAREAR